VAPADGPMMVSFEVVARVLYERDRDRDLSNTGVLGLPWYRQSAETRAFYKREAERFMFKCDAAQRSLDRPRGRGRR
jgi:hypothetical protein